MPGHRVRPDTGGMKTATAHETMGEVIQMVKVSIRVHKGAARFDVAVQAESLERAISLVRGRYSSADVLVRSMSGPGARIAGRWSPGAMAA